MSLLIQVAQTRQGAERLLEARLLSTLASCDYLDARPEADQAFLGMFLPRALSYSVSAVNSRRVFSDHDSFLPSAVQRYHQLFMPALQLVDGLLATLGPGHATALSQVRLSVSPLLIFKPV